MPVFLILAMLFVTAMLIVCKITFRVVRLKSKPCRQVLWEIRDVNMAEIAAVARGAHLEQAQHLCSRDLIVRLGGMAGLRRLGRNANAMIDVARYLTLMRPEDDVLADIIRKDALIVRRLVFLLRCQDQLGVSLLKPDLIRYLARRYCCITRNMGALCNTLVFELLPVLCESIDAQAHLFQIDEVTVERYC